MQIDGNRNDAADLEKEDFNSKNLKGKNDFTR